jgi:hypothetical protein
MTAYNSGFFKPPPPTFPAPPVIPPDMVLESVAVAGELLFTNSGDIVTTIRGLQNVT